jgi:hypothetical protein
LTYFKIVDLTEKLHIAVKKSQVLYALPKASNGLILPPLRQLLDHGVIAKSILALPEKRAAGDDAAAAAVRSTKCRFDFTVKMCYRSRVL